MKNTPVAFLFIGAALVSLLAGLVFGVIGGLQYVLPEFLKEHFPFIKTRPMHVTLIVTWLFTGAIGGIYHYLPQLHQGKLYSVRLALWHFVIFIATGLAIITCYVMGYFGGKEYFEFPPIIAMPMMLTWILFAINFFKSIHIKINAWPVYIWMWATGVIFFLITFTEAFLWTIPYFGNNIVRDMTVQWKATGTFIGSWNMLIYGTAFYVMNKISGEDKIVHSPYTFFFYFLGLINLMFNWGHHTYVVPAAGWIKNVSCVISMTELLLLGSIIWSWRKSISDAKRNFHIIPFRLLSFADLWIFLNLILAILISIPGINHYTHGTHITVGHAMGTTIGINTMILFSSFYFIAGITSFSSAASESGKIKSGFWIANISLLVFWVSLIGSGIVKALEKENVIPFQLMMQKLSPWFRAFTFSGFFLFIGLFLLTIPLMKVIYKKLSREEKK